MSWEKRATCNRIKLFEFPEEQMQDHKIMITVEKLTYKQIDTFKNRFERLLRFFKIYCAVLLQWLLFVSTHLVFSLIFRRA